MYTVVFTTFLKVQLAAYTGENQLKTGPYFLISTVPVGVGFLRQLMASQPSDLSGADVSHICERLPGLLLYLEDLFNICEYLTGLLLYLEDVSNICERLTGLLLYLENMSNICERLPDLLNIPEGCVQ